MDRFEGRREEMVHRWVIRAGAELQPGTVCTAEEVVVVAQQQWKCSFCSRLCLRDGVGVLTLSWS
jgi:hypothetical protein